MRYAKYVVVGQVVLSAVLLVIFVARSGASSTKEAAKAKAAAAVTADRHGDDEAEEAVEKPAKPRHKKAKAAEEDAHDEGHGKSAHGENAHDSKLSDSKGKDKEAGKTPRLLGSKEVAEGNEPVVLGTDPKMIAKNLLAGNARFAEGRRSGFNLVAQRETSAQGQKPGVMVLGCADSRVPPELIFDRGVGEMFVVRSAGNIAEPVAVGSLEYAAEHLHAKVLIVLGHEKCGAVSAALSEAKMPSANLEAVVGNILPAVKELKSWVEGSDLLHMAVEANVRRQAEEVMKKSTILRQAVAKKELTLLKAVYDLDTGQVHPL